MQVSLNVELKANVEPYMIMPCSLLPDTPFTYQLDIYHPCEHHVEAVSATPREGTAHVAMIHGEWTQETAGGCRHHPTWQMNKQYRISLPSNEPTRALICLSQNVAPERFNHLLSIGMYVCYTVIRTRTALGAYSVFGFPHRKQKVHILRLRVVPWC